MTALLLHFPEISPSQIDPPAKDLKKNPSKKEKYSPEFEAFWSPYPRKLNCSKLMAYKAWCKLDDDDHEQAMAALPVFVRMCRGKDEQFIPHAATWLNQRRFETIQIPATRYATAIDWASVMKLYYMTSNWKQEYGPAPGRPGCRVPPEYLGDMS